LILEDKNKEHNKNDPWESFWDYYY
jgi:hypothetical protein